MPSPFPGMDPYLEAQGLGEGFHAMLVACCAESLNRDLPDSYYYSAGSIAVENANDAGEVACNKPEAQAKRIVPPSAAPSRPVNSGLGDLVLIATCLYSGVW